MWMWCLRWRLWARRMRSSPPSRLADCTIWPRDRTPIWSLEASRRRRRTRPRGESWAEAAQLCLGDPLAPPLGVSSVVLGTKMESRRQIPTWRWAAARLQGRLPLLRFPTGHTHRHQLARLALLTPLQTRRAWSVGLPLQLALLAAGPSAPTTSLKSSSSNSSSAK